MQGHDAHAPHGAQGRAGAGQKVAKDPVCGMTVPADAPLRTTYQGETYVFCSEHCLARFKKEPERYTRKAEERGTPQQIGPTADQPPPTAPTQWTCPSRTRVTITAAASKYTPTCPASSRNESGNTPGRSVATKL